MTPPMFARLFLILLSILTVALKQRSGVSSPPSEPRGAMAARSAPSRAATLHSAFARAIHADFAPRTDPDSPLSRHPAERAVRAVVRHRDRNDLCRRNADVERADASRAVAGARRRSRALHAGRSSRTSGQRLRPNRADDRSRSARVSIREPVRCGDGVRRHRRGARGDRRRHRARRRGSVRRRARRATSSSCARSSGRINGRCSSAASCRCTSSPCDDGAGTEVYVSPSIGEVRLVTTTKTRTLAWIATIPHWIYFTPLRTNQPLWYWTVVVTSALGCVLALLGLVLGVTQLNKSKPFRWSTAVRYQAGCAGTTSPAPSSACSR